VPDRHRLYWDEFKQIKSLFPPPDEQRRILNWINAETEKLDALVSKILDGITRLKEFRTALISAAVTGKIDVREEVP
jgi:type I restriction enzyme, S subunit